MNRKGFGANLKGNWVGTSVKAVGIVLAGAAIVLLGMTIGKQNSAQSHWPEAGKFVGIRHEAGSMPPTGDALPGVPTPAATEAQDTDTVVRNGITVVSPRLLVPAIDAELMRAAGESQDAASAGKAVSQKPSRYAKQSHTRRQPRVASSRWKAYGSTVR